MISSETPYKLAEIIRDTWPNLYRKQEIDYYNKKNFYIESEVDAKKYGGVKIGK